MNFQKNKNKYLLLSIYIFVLFFVSASVALADQQPVKLKANPSTVVPGGTSTITWSAPGADYCVSSWSGSNWNTSGTFKTPKLTSNTKYTISCYNPALKFCIGKTNASKDLCQTKTADKCISPSTPDCYLKTYLGAAELTVNVAIPDGTITDVSTQEVKDKTSNTAVLLGSMNPNGWGENDASAKAYFRYSSVSPESITPIFCNDIYGSNMKSTKEIIVYGHTIQQANIEITNLSPDTTYYYCMVGSTPKQIAYGGVKSFTTFMPEGKVSIKTENARVIDENSVYLNGTYNTTNPAETWFEYRQTGAILEGLGGNNLSFFKKLENKILSFFGVNNVLAVSPTTFEWSKRINIIKHKGSSSGKLYYLLENLSPGTGYETRAAIKVIENPKIPSSGQTIYGETKSFTTVGTSGSNAGDPNNTGGGYEDPCTDPLDVNCNGTGDPGNGGGGTGSDPGNGGGTLNDTPDLTASTTSPSQIIVNKSTKIYSNIKNIGAGSTLKDFYNFFQISNVDPSNYGDIPDEINPPMSFLKNIFKINIASAISSPLINLSSNLMPALSGHGFKTISQDYTFPSVGIYYIRVCADKKSPTDTGLIKELYESNNCGPWTKTTVSLEGGTGGGGGGGGTGGGTGGGGTGNDPSGGGTGGGTGGGGTGGGGGGGGTGTWIWTSGGNGAGNGSWTWTGNSNYTGGGTGTGTGNNTNPGNGETLNLTIGQKIDPPADAVVRYHEGIETVFARQIISNQELAKSYGYSEGDNLDTFAWSLADTLARTFGYVDSKGKEIRVSQPDIAAYQLYMNNGILTVYEYYDSTIVNIQKMSGFLRIKYYYEYYFKK